MTMSATIPLASVAAANAALEELGHGPNNFTIPLRLKPGNGPADHMGFHLGGNDPVFLADVLSLQADFPALDVSVGNFELDADGNQVPVQGINWGKHMARKGLERMPEEQQL